MENCLFQSFRFPYKLPTLPCNSPPSICPSRMSVTCTHEPRHLLVLYCCSQGTLGTRPWGAFQRVGHRTVPVCILRWPFSFFGADGLEPRSVANRKQSKSHGSTPQQDILFVLLRSRFQPPNPYKSLTRKPIYLCEPLLLSTL